MSCIQIPGSLGESMFMVNAVKSLSTIDCFLVGYSGVMIIGMDVATSLNLYPVSKSSKPPASVLCLKWTATNSRVKVTINGENCSCGEEIFLSSSHWNKLLCFGYWCLPMEKFSVYLPSSQCKYFRDTWGLSEIIREYKAEYENIIWR